MGAKDSAVNENEEQEEAMQVDDEGSSDSDDEVKTEKKKSKEEETNDKENAGANKGCSSEEQDKLQQVVKEDSKWVELLFDSIRSTASDEADG